jgi:hypothetical protein
MKIYVVVFWAMTPRSEVVGSQRFVGPCRLHPQGEVNNGQVEVTLQVIASQSVSLSVCLSLSQSVRLAVELLLGLMTIF